MDRPEQDATLVFLRRDDQVLLGMKKRGFGKGKWNGFGGKPEDGESVEECAIREMQEECGVIIAPEDLKSRGYIDFFFSEKQDWDQRVHLFEATSWEGRPEETEEMLPKWFDEEELDFSSMWIDDKYWLPKFLEGHELKASFVFGGEGEGSFIESIDFESPADHDPEIKDSDKGE